MVTLADINEASRPHRRRKRVGRGSGSGHGKTSTRGHNGDGSRSGGKSRRGYEGGQMPLFRRVAKRGFGNAAFKKQYVVINLDQLSSRFTDGDDVCFDRLREVFSLRKDAKVKILGRGELSVKLSLQAHSVSGSAENAIAAAGGSVTLI